MNLKIDKDLIKQVANNANLSLDEKETNSLEKDFKEILSNFEILNKAKISKDTKPSFHPIPVKNKMRDDEIKESNKEALKNVKDISDGYIRGPKVI